MIECAVILATAFVLDLVLGDPMYRLHPVRLMGHQIAWLEKRLFHTGLSGFGGGLVLASGTVACTLGVFGLFVWLWYVFPAGGIAGFIFLVYSCTGFMDLFSHALPIRSALAADNTKNARMLLQRIVGRDASRLDEEGIARAAVESVAENFVDGFLAVVFWFAAGALAALAAGLPPAPTAAGFAIAYRAINTLDAMVGYKNIRYERFGTASARADDMLNFIPARLSMPVIAAAALACRMDVRGCLRIGISDRLKHVSPNAGHAESCVAGALSIRLGGPVRYPGKTVDKPWMGDGTGDISPGHILDACRLVFFAGFIWVLFILFVLAVAA